MVERAALSVTARHVDFRSERTAAWLRSRPWSRAQSVVAVARVGSDLVASVMSLSFAWLLAGMVPDPLHRFEGTAANRLPDGLTAAEFVLLSAGLIGFLAARGHYQRRIPFWSELRQVLVGSVLVLLFNSFFEFAFQTANSRVLVVSAWAMFPVAAMCMRHVTRRALCRAGVWRIPALIAGDGETARQAVRTLLSEAALGYEVVGQISLPTLAAWPPGHVWSRTMQQHQAHLVILAPDADDNPQNDLVAALVRERVPFAIMPPLQGLPVADCQRTYFFNHDTVMLSYRNNLLQPVARMAKMGFDLFVAVALLLFLSPILIAIAIAVKLDGGPVLYSHERIGSGGRRFGCLKFRSMVVNGDAILQKLLSTDPAAAHEWSATRKLRDDPRVTRMGALLRKTSLDELPQLLNILRLDMSLVGPRPIVEKEMVHYGDDIAYYLEARPGLTGLWQVSGRSDTTYAQRVHLDTWYVKNWTLWHDVAILAKTVPAVLKRNGAV